MTDKKTEALKLAQTLEEESQDNPDDYRWKAAQFIYEALAEHSTNRPTSGLDAYPQEQVAAAKKDILSAVERHGLAKQPAQHRHISYVCPQCCWSLEEQPAQQGCSRSHPHENMDAMCELRTEIARLTNENARLKAHQQEPSDNEMAMADLLKTDVQTYRRFKQWDKDQQQEPVAVMTVLHLKDRTEIGYGPASAGYDLPTGEYKLYTSPRLQRR